MLIQDFKIFKTIHSSNLKINLTIAESREYLPYREYIENFINKAINISINYHRNPLIKLFGFLMNEQIFVELICIKIKRKIFPIIVKLIDLQNTKEIFPAKFTTLVNINNLYHLLRHNPNKLFKSKFKNLIDNLNIPFLDTVQQRFMDDIFTEDIHIKIVLREWIQKMNNQKIFLNIHSSNAIANGISNEIINVINNATAGKDIPNFNIREYYTRLPYSIYEKIKKKEIEYIIQDEYHESILTTPINYLYDKVYIPYRYNNHINMDINNCHEIYSLIKNITEICLNSVITDFDFIFITDDNFNLIVKSSKYHIRYIPILYSKDLNNQIKDNTIYSSLMYNVFNVIRVFLVNYLVHKFDIIVEEIRIIKSDNEIVTLIIKTKNQEFKLSFDLILFKIFDWT